MFVDADIVLTSTSGWAHGFRTRGHKLLQVGVLARNGRAIRSYEGAGYTAYGITMRRYL